MKSVLFRCVKLELGQVRLFSQGVRVRFAPSPTGFLHLGGLRTALFNFLLAKSRKGKFILRIEDTDRKRLVAGAAEALEQDLIWAGLTPDESPLKGGDFGPYAQSERTQMYVKEARRLLDNGSAYYCFCSERRLEMLRKNAIRNGEVPKYDNHCRSLKREEVESKLKANKDNCIRFKLTSGKGFDDLVYGSVHYSVENVEGDPVILKQDGWPTYHLASVVDDHYMAISHVVRGVEWLQSTDKHLMIYRALDFKPPVFAHLPLLLNPDGSKLSKRQGDITIRSLRSKGVEPRALVNLLSSVGGGFFKDKPDKSISLEQMIDFFDINLVNSNSCKLPFEKLKDYNQEELKRKINDPNSLELLKETLKQSLIEKYSQGENVDLELEDPYIKNVLICFQNRVSFIDDLLDKNLSFLWIKPNSVNLDESSVNLLTNLAEMLKDLNFESDGISPALKAFSSRNKIPFKTIMVLLRSVLCGNREGPGVAEMLQLLGKGVVISRLDAALLQNT